MTTIVPPQLVQRDRQTRPTEFFRAVAVVTFAVSLVLQLSWTTGGRAQELRGLRDPLPDPCLENLPVPAPIPPDVRVVQLVNCNYASGQHPCLQRRRDLRHCTHAASTVEL